MFIRIILWMDDLQMMYSILIFCPQQIYIKKTNKVRKLNPCVEILNLKVWLTYPWFWYIKFVAHRSRLQMAVFVSAWFSRLAQLMYHYIYFEVFCKKWANWVECILFLNHLWVFLCELFKFIFQTGTSFFFATQYFLTPFLTLLHHY